MRLWVVGVLFLGACQFGTPTAERSVAQDAPAACSHDSRTFRCVKVLKNYDGDTLTVEIPGVHPLIGKGISVRIAGIDTPEVKTKNDCEKQAGRIAKNLLTSLLKNAKQVDLTEVDRDKYFRILADVKVDGKSVKDIMLKNHVAYDYDGGTKEKRDWCKALSRMGTGERIPTSN